MIIEEKKKIGSLITSVFECFMGEDTDETSRGLQQSLQSFSLTISDNQDLQSMSLATQLFKNQVRLKCTRVQDN